MRFPLRSAVLIFVLVALLPCLARVRGAALQFISVGPVTRPSSEVPHF